MLTLASYLGGEWISGSGKKATLVNPATEEPIAETSTEGLDFGKAVDFARNVGGPALRAMTFAERGALCGAMSKAIHAHREELFELAIQNGGNTRSDAKFDVDGAWGTLAYYAELAKGLGDARALVDGEGVQLGRSPRFFGQHMLVPRAGVAVHVNAFNFPAWGFGEKAACAILAGMPVITKPATSTAVVAFRIAQILVEAKVLPPGAFSLVSGSPGDLLSHLGGQDVLAFTGSGDTAAHLRRLDNVVSQSVRVNVEADSLNGAILGPDVEPGSETYNLFLRDVVRDMTQKAGQKCTAIRRVFVPEASLERVREELVDRLSQAVVGDPSRDDVTVGPVATASQLRDVSAGIARIAEHCEKLTGAGPFERRGAPEGKGFFVPPTLFLAKDVSPKAVHDHEVFGPVSTVLPYGGTAEELVAPVARGGGGLVCSVYSDDRAFTGDVLFGIAPFHGRVVLGSEKIADQTPGPGTVLPQSIHGGPGRAGGGEELGGARGLGLYMQRVAVQGSRPIIEALLGIKKQG